METFIKTPYFGILLSIFTYILGGWISKKIKNPLFNPLLLAMFMCIGILKIFKIEYEDFNVGGQYITFLVAPATVALVVNLYKNLDLLIKNIVPVIIGVFVGAMTSVLTIYAGAKIFGWSQELKYSLVPKSLTTAIGTALSGEYGGIVSITVVSIVLTGIMGAAIAPTLLKIIKVEDPVAKGISIGTTAHAVGTSRALQMGEVEGGMSGLAIALAGFISVIIIPVIIKILG
ncbi:LrgB family protein [Peptoniphilus sp. GNH]|nr:LrgB family protein [Peptoniphilus sp. GNH]